MSLDTLPLTVILEESATLYETVAALPPVVERVETARHSRKPGSTPPPGVGDLLDADEHQRAVQAVDEWAHFLAHVLVDEVDGLGAVPDSTPGRLRLASRWAEHFESHDDTHLRYAIGLDAREHLVTLRRLSKRGVRVVRTGLQCRAACGGHLVSPLGASEDRHQDSLVCDRNSQHQVPYSEWSRWPRARVRYITAEHAAKLIGTTVQGVYQRARRGRWRRVGTGRDVRYDVRDVRASLGLEPLADILDATNEDPRECANTPGA